VLFEPWKNIEDPKYLYGAASGVQGTQRIVKCSACAMVYENPRYPEELIVGAYQDAQEQGHDSQYSSRVNSFYRALVSLRELIPKSGGRILDIGTAGGAFLSAAEQYGYQAVGLEPSQYLVDQARKRGLTVQQGTIDSNPLEPASFDMVCLWDVIEHLAEPKKALATIRLLSKPGGILLINFPDIGTWQAKLAGRRFWWILSVHLHHFSRNTIAEICRRTGFETFHFQRYWQTLEFGYLEQMAIHYRIPLSGLLKRLTPAVVQRLPVPYYASQTTALARRTE
jgi:2-polyprenyl-3-methyl-5-hydroxy-6-metoxy-1,4-benzoquinol methylase